MKKTLYLLLLCSLFSCNIVKKTTTLEGDVTAYSSNGDIIKKWNDVIIEEQVNENGETTYYKNSIKRFGINFYDDRTGKYIILSNAVPYIIEYDVYKKTEIVDAEGDEVDLSRPDVEELSRQDVEELSEQYKKLAKDLKNNKLIMKNLNNSSVEYKKLRVQNKSIQKQLSAIKAAIYHKTGTFVIL